MDQRKVKTEAQSVDQTFGNAASEGFPERETRIRIHSGFQESYLSH